MRHPDVEKQIDEGLHRGGRSHAIVRRREDQQVRLLHRVEKLLLFEKKRTSLLVLNARVAADAAVIQVARQEELREFALRCEAVSQHSTDVVRASLVILSVDGDDSHRNPFLSLVATAVECLLIFVISLYAIFSLRVFSRG